MVISLKKQWQKPRQCPAFHGQREFVERRHAAEVSRRHVFQRSAAAANAGQAASLTLSTDIERTLSLVSTLPGQWPARAEQRRHETGKPMMA